MNRTTKITSFVSGKPNTFKITPAEASRQAGMDKDSFSGLKGVILKIRIETMIMDSSHNIPIRTSIFGVQYTQYMP